jgi:uncharacterized protein YlxP (DUF503 family)
MYLPAPDEKLLIGVLRLVLVIPASQSLKDRRKILASLRDRSHARHHASFAEVGHLNAMDRAVVAFCMAGSDRRNLQSRLDTLRADVEQSSEALIESQHTEIISCGGHILK